jgi:hypothetical protein
MPKVCCFSKTIEVQNDFWYPDGLKKTFSVWPILLKYWLYSIPVRFAFLPFAYYCSIYYLRCAPRTDWLTDSCIRRCIPKPKKARCSRLIFWLRAISSIQLNILFQRLSLFPHWVAQIPAPLPSENWWKSHQLSSHSLDPIYVLQSGTFSTNVSKSKRGTGCQEEI